MASSRKIGIVITRKENLSKVDLYNASHAEFILFEKGERKELEDFIRKRGLSFAIHFPLFRPSTDDHPLSLCLLDFNDERRRQGLELAKDSVRLASEMGAKYVTVHLQRPLGITGERDISLSSEHCLQILSRSIEELLETARKHTLRVFAENMVTFPGFCMPEDYARPFERFPQLGFCFDVGHTPIDARIFGFSIEEFVSATARYITSTHLYNNPLPARLEYLNLEIYAKLDTRPQRTREGIQWLRRLIDGRAEKE